MSELEGRSAIITGGARGIGLGIARAFVKEGVGLVLTDLSAESLAVAAATLAEVRADVPVVTTVADGKDPDAAPRVVAEAVQRFGRIDVLVNNAQQFPKAAPIESIRWEDMAASYDSGVFATWRYMAAAFEYLKATQGTVLNMGSGAGVNAQPEHGAYASNKEAIRGLSRVAARDWGRYGITVNVLNPRAHSAESKRLLEEQPEQIAAVLAKSALGRFGDPELNVGGLCVFLAKSEGKFMTGSTFDVNGGGSIRP
ncbi:SDR family oxidoreductase [Pseudonocardia halophobica]|uniref:Short-chain dehydrogenase n=1 Tax=Pseudonocardia halophobica TaxID=29401 RepID=A0A9W6NVG3_9PSEU|nr:SDR family oxidoreductase [Pseudonocardia halophobica]GLL10573.1 short-chain dehydrogenase [Pseudonocardia halophobica]